MRLCCLMPSKKRNLYLRKRLSCWNGMVLSKVVEKHFHIEICSLGDKSRKGTLAGERSWRCWSRIFQIIWKTSKRNIKLKIYWQQCVGTGLSFVKIVNGRWRNSPVWACKIFYFTRSTSHPFLQKQSKSSARRECNVVCFVSWLKQPRVLWIYAENS